jgi:D-inositol-3-phosphate glycosyltransferase
VHTSPLDQPGTGDAGGMNVYVADLARALARRGSEVEIFTRRTSSALAESVRLDDGVTVRHVSAGPFEGLAKIDLAGQLCAFTAGVLRAEAGRTEGWYDVVHSHYWLSGHVGWLAADRWDVPLVHTMHTMAAVKNAALAPGDEPEPPVRLIGEQQLVDVADALVASTDDERSALMDHYGADPSRVFVVPPGVDLALFQSETRTRAQLRRLLGLPEFGHLVLFAGRVQPLKGPDVLVRALGVLAATGREVPHLVILGGPSGRPTAVRELQAMAEALGVGHRVTILPPVARPELARWYRAADLVAMPSYNETFGLVAAEAQASGTPVIATAVGGLRTVVEDGRTGMLVDGHDPAVWADRLAELLADDLRLLTLGVEAQRRAERFGWDAAAGAMLDVYAHAGSRRRAVAATS